MLSAEEVEPGVPPDLVTAEGWTADVGTRDDDSAAALLLAGGGRCSMRMPHSDGRAAAAGALASVPAGWLSRMVFTIPGRGSGCGLRASSAWHDEERSTSQGSCLSEGYNLGEGVVCGASANACEPKCEPCRVPVPQISVTVKYKAGLAVAHVSAKPPVRKSSSSGLVDSAGNMPRQWAALSAILPVFSAHIYDYKHRFVFDAADAHAKCITDRVNTATDLQRTRIMWQ